MPGPPHCLVGAPTPEPESRLLAGLRSDDPQARAALVRRYGGRMLAVARRFLRCEEDSTDAVQDAFLSAFQSIDSFAGKADLGTRLHRIVTNTCLMKLRSRACQPAVSINDLFSSGDEPRRGACPSAASSGPAYAPLISAETCAQVRACIDRLPRSYRDVVLLRDIQEMDTDQTAAALQLSPAAVKTRLHRARLMIREVFASYMVE